MDREKAKPYHCVPALLLMYDCAGYSRTQGPCTYNPQIIEQEVKCIGLRKKKKKRRILRLSGLSHT
jgi:hypothetical protein